jgi:flagellar hook-associated protein 3 FlgL
MITNLDAISELFLSQVGRMQRKLSEANRQVSSGKRIASASDAPEEVESLLQLRSVRVRNEQVRSNLTLAKSMAQSADAAIASGLQLLDRALVLANQGANGTMDDGGRKSIALDVQSLLEQMVHNSRTAVQGRYIFSGDQDNTPAYDLDLTSPTGVVQLATSTATARVEDSAGGSFAATKTAQEIFDARDGQGNPTSSNVFAGLNGLRVALAANDGTAIGNSISAIKQAAYHLNSMGSFYGTVERRVEDAANYADRYANQVKGQIAQKEDADVAAAALEMSQTTTQMQAAFQMRAKIPRNSLFDYLG